MGHPDSGKPIAPLPAGTEEARRGTPGLGCGRCARGGRPTGEGCTPGGAPPDDKGAAHGLPHGVQPVRF